MIDPVFPIALSSSLVGAYKQCPRKFFYEYILNRVPKGKSVHLVAGSAYACGLEAFRKHYYTHGPKSFAEAIKHGFIALTKEYGNLEPAFTYKTWDRVAQSFLSYFSYWEPEKDIIQPTIINNKPAVEFSFAIPLENLKHPTSLDPILYAGRYDALMDMAGGIHVYDDKTTGAIGEKWAEQWNMRAQFTGYQWGAEKSGIPIQGIIIRGCCIQKTQIKFNQHITYRAKWRVEEWYEDLIYTIEDILRDWKRNYFALDLGTACESYGGCPFKVLCEVEKKETWIGVEFQERTWEPIRVESL